MLDCWRVKVECGPVPNILHDYSQIQVIYPELARAKLGITGGVLAEREINTTAPLSGGGDLSSDRTFSLTKAAVGVDGYLSGADFAKFNGKQAALTFMAPLSQFGGNVSIPANRLIPGGGTTGQSLAKVSNADFDVDWTTVSGGSGLTNLDGGHATTIYGGTTGVDGGNA